MNDNRVIFHIDVNSAFLSWEAVYRLEELGETVDIREIPSAVGGDIETRHGVILAKSIPAKKYNVQTGEPVVHALRKCPDLYLVKPHHSMYKEKSQAFIQILKSYTDQVEQVSIDEAYMEVTDLIKNREAAVQLAERIKDEIHENLHFTVNVGISTNKLLAKMASDFKKPNLVHTLFPDQMQEKMWPLPVGDLLFAGKAAQRELEKLGIKTIGDLARMDLAILQGHMKKQGELLWNYANGYDDSPIETKRADNKGYGNSTTLSENVVDAETAKKVLLELSEKVAARLRKDNMVIQSVSVGIRFHNLKRVSHQTTLEEATNNTSVIYEKACQLFNEFWDGTPIRLLAVQTSGAIPNEGFHQMNLFELMSFEEKTGRTVAAKGRSEYTRVEQEKLDKLDRALDSIREKFGVDSIKRASNLKDAGKDKGKM